MNVWISLKISLKFVPKIRIKHIPALVQIMAWCRSGDKPLSEPILVILLTYICVTRHQWVKMDGARPYRTHMPIYSIHVPGWLQKWLNLITAPGSVSNEPGSVTWLATKYFKTVSWRNHTEKLTTWWPQNISFWPKINIPSSYFTMVMLNCLENTLKLQFDSYVTAVRFLT